MAAGVLLAPVVRRQLMFSETTACPPLAADEGKAADARVDTADRNGCIKGKGRKHHSRRRVRSPSFDEELSPRPKRKKRKRKSERKRKRKRSPSHSLSPPRKKKKKKKKSSKKSKRHRYTSKKSKHSSSSLKHKRKDERKHKKSRLVVIVPVAPYPLVPFSPLLSSCTSFSSRTRPHRRRRYRRSESDSSCCHSSAEDRNYLHRSVVHQAVGGLAAVGEEGVKWRPATKSVCKTAPKYRSILSTATISSSKPGGELSHGKGPQHSSSQTEGPHDYDSGNDTSSPLSSKTGVSLSSVADNKGSTCQRAASPEKLKFTDRDNASDSGNSVTSYTSLCKPYREDSLSATLFSGNGKRTRHSKRAPKRRTDAKHARKVSGKRQRRKSYSPMKKRRRDSPSHLEARRITSARKRPIPYFRPSPSSSSRSTSVSSWSSLFTRSRSRSPIHSISRSRSRSHSYSSYSRYSRSSSFNSIFGTRSRSRSCGPANKRKKTRR
ncbi:hypothetical protein F2P81_014321 [Scophthalmus maximus]|uniref:Serine/arginine repetitive matrix protein C-terminal domain-containing protein n=1 Tax=Scophthalmus maximus TaxID=52904 RepID=A0A6A4SNW0_SCOMX|nr:hypothetical protein F2P81_014321 [Scophthalmus maximus]